MEHFDFVSVAAITIICYMAGEIAKRISSLDNKWIPIVCGVLGAILGIVAFYSGMPDFPGNDAISAIAIGIVSGLAATGAHQMGHQMKSTNE